MSFLCSKVIHIKELKITYREQGVGEPCIFLHGLAGNSKSWKYQFDAFSHQKKIIAWDAPGYGGSDCVTPNVDAYSNTLVAFLNALDLSKIDLVGHSMGGIVASYFASRYPNRIKRLILSCTHIGNGMKKGLPLSKAYADRINSLLNDPKEVYGEKRARAMLTPSAHKGAFSLASKIASETRPEGLEAATRVVQETDNSSLVKNLMCPVTIICGENDPVVSRSRTHQLQSLVSHSILKVVPSSGHAPYLEFPTVFNQFIKMSLSE
jgi:pimeloyl-ACP methyl ester carboxylesterase